VRAVLICALAAPCVAASVGATDLVNKDSVSYAISVSAGGGVMKGDIAGKTTKIGVCASSAVKCVVKVEGVGEIEVTGADDVIVQNGRLSKK
jgi:hypothetical protein